LLFALDHILTLKVRIMTIGSSALLGWIVCTGVWSLLQGTAPTELWFVCTTHILVVFHRIRIRLAQGELLEGHKLSRGRGEGGENGSGMAEKRKKAAGKVIMCIMTGVPHWDFVRVLY
jgi:hypothetical protein